MFPLERDKLYGANHRLRTQTLFWESRHADPDGDVIFTLKEDDLVKGLKTYYSLKKLYLSHNDPTEYSFAMSVFDSWKTWKDLRSSPFLRDHVKDWKEELIIKMRSDQLVKVAAIANDPDASSSSKLNSAKFLYDEMSPKSSTRGRPTKEEVEGERKHAARVSEQVKSDMERLGLKVV